jgi:hypothetical protein
MTPPQPKSPFAPYARPVRLPQGVTAAELRKAIGQARSLVGMLIGTTSLEGRGLTRPAIQFLKRQAVCQLLGFTPEPSEGPPGDGPASGPHASRLPG